MAIGTFILRKLKSLVTPTPSSIAVILTREAIKRFCEEPPQDRNYKIEFHLIADSIGDISIKANRKLERCLEVHGIATIQSWRFKFTAACVLQSCDDMPRWQGEHVTLVIRSETEPNSLARRHYTDMGKLQAQCWIENEVLKKFFPMPVRYAN